MSGKQGTKDLTTGNPLWQLISFTIPLIFGNLFQLTYNMVDSIVIGRCAGEDALAAVGTSDPVMNLLILGVTGLCIGASVLMSNFYGAGRDEDLRKEVGTTLVLVMSFSFVILILGLACSGLILRAMQVPETVLPLAETYLRLIFIGMPFTCLYNIYAAALRSVGDAGTPIRFLMLASVLNGCLDVLFVAGLHLGVTGAALATVIAEALSAVLCVMYVVRHVPYLHLKRSHFVWDRKLAGMTIRYGGMSSLQQCSQPIGKLLIQGVINTMGVSAMAAFNAVGKIEDFGLVPGRSISNAMMTFTAQNDGAGKEERIREGFRKGMLLEFSYWVIICIVLLLLDRNLLLLFSREEMTLAEGMKYFSLMAFFYWLPGVTNGHQGFFRGIGKMRITLLGTVTQISVRVLMTFLLVPRMGIVGVGWACIVGWTVQLAWQGTYRYRITQKRKKSKETK